MNYLDARPLIEDGDIIFFKPVNFFARLIALLSRGHYSHCGIAVWIHDGRGVPRLAIIEGYSGGCRLVTMSHYEKRPFVALDIGIDWPYVEEYAYNKTGDVAYGYFDFLWIWLKESLVRLGCKRLAARIPNAHGEVCSEVVADIARQAKQYQIESTLMSPSALYLHLCKFAVKEICVG